MLCDRVRGFCSRYDEGFDDARGEEQGGGGAASSTYVFSNLGIAAAEGPENGPDDGVSVGGRGRAAAAATPADNEKPKRPSAPPPPPRIYDDDSGRGSRSSWASHPERR